MTLLSIHNLSLMFQSPVGRVEAVKNVSLEINPGEMLALVGESGSGKSLTALACLGLQPPSASISGSIILDGIEAIGTPLPILKTLRGKRAGMIFQEPMTALNPLHTIGRQIYEMLEVHGTRGVKAQDRMQEVLGQVGLAHFKDRLDSYPHQLSGGERQRVMIAMAIANKPNLLIADEPTTAVDVTLQVKILKLIKDLQRDMGMAILFITHDLTVVRKLADRVAIMAHGEIVEQGKVAELFASPKHPYTQKLLASAPSGEAVPLPAAHDPVIRCENLKTWFPIKKGFLRRTRGYVKAVDDVSLTVEKGTTLGIVGESGSGKTTLGFSLLRLIKSEGKIVYLGEEINRLQTGALRPLRKEMQVVFQDPYSSLNPRMNVAQIIEEGLFVHYPEISEEERKERVDSILVEMGLSPDIRDRFPHEFSGGQRQRISIARAMVLKPKLVVLDEPTSALDLTVQKQIIDLLKSLQSKYGLSYVFISHDLRTIRAIAHRIIVMRQGQIVEMNDTSTLLAAPKSDYARALIDAAFLKG